MDVIVMWDIMYSRKVFIVIDVMDMNMYLINVCVDDDWDDDDDDNCESVVSCWSFIICDISINNCIIINGV